MFVDQKTNLNVFNFLLQVTMSKEEGAQTVVIGGKVDVQQQYCGTVGGQSTDFSTIDTEVKVSDSHVYLRTLNLITVLSSLRA